MLGLGQLPLRATTTQEQMLVTMAYEEFRLDEKCDCSGMRSWEKVVEKRGVGFRYSRPKENMKSTLAYLNCIWF